MQQLKTRKPFIFAFIATIVFVGFLVGNTFVSDTENESVSRVTPAIGPNFGSRSATDSKSGVAVQDGSRGRNQAVAEPRGPYHSNQPGDPNSQYVIRSGEVEILIDKGEVVSVFEELKDLLPEGSYISESDLTQEKANLLIKIPTDRLDETVKEFRELGLIDREKLTTTDIEAQYTQNEKSLEKLQERLSKLKTELDNAKNENEKESIQRKIDSVKREIENSEQRKGEFDEEIELSTLVVELRTEKPEVDRAILFKAWETSSNTILVTVSGIMIVISALLPFVIILLLGFLTAKAFKSRRNDQD